jgi:hypothetical protein
MPSAPAMVQPKCVPGVSFESRYLNRRALLSVMVCPALAGKYLLVAVSYASTTSALLSWKNRWPTIDPVLIL